jgi:anti-sigma factor RsiW
MQCPEMENLVHAYLDAEIDAARSAEFELHLRQCEGCWRAYETHRGLREAIHAAGLRHSAPSAARELVHRAVLSEAGVRQTSSPHFGTSWSRWLGLAACLIITAGVTWQLATRLHPPSDLLVQEMIASHVRSMQADHLTDVISSDQHTVKPWFSGKLDFSPRVLDLRAEGFELVGGRLDYLDGRSVAALVYRRNGHIINLFQAPASEVTSANHAGLLNVRGYHMQQWNENGMWHGVVSDMAAAEVDHFMRLWLQSPSSPTTEPR